jgi:hypothetical protein
MRNSHSHRVSRSTDAPEVVEIPGEIGNVKALQHRCPQPG